METDTSEYTFITIFSIIMKEKKVYLVIFYWCIFKVAELNYNMYNTRVQQELCNTSP